MITAPSPPKKSGTDVEQIAAVVESQLPSTAGHLVRRRSATLRWIGASLLVVIAAITLVGLNGTTPNAREPLHPESASPEGAKALVQVLRDHGVPVRLAQGREAGLRLLGSSGRSTLVMTAPAIPSDAAIESIRELVAVADQTVFLVADEKILSEFELGEIGSNDADELVSEAGNSACPAGNFGGVGEIRAQVLFDPAADIQGCFSRADGQAALIVAPRAPGSVISESVSMIDATELFDNTHLAESGNAALAFALLGDTDQVVWYLATPEDIAADRVGTLAALTPKWVTPVMVLLLLTAVAAAVWRGRRFGPLVEEHLPVTVRASETMLGRARLAARIGDSDHAAAALRDGATLRLTRKLGLPRTASPEQVARAVPHEPELMHLLGGTLPTGDAELMSFARALGRILDNIDPLPGTPRDSPKHPNATDERSTL